MRIISMDVKADYSKMTPNNTKIVIPYIKVKLIKNSKDKKDFETFLKYFIDKGYYIVINNGSYEISQKELRDLKIKPSLLKKIHTYDSPKYNPYVVRDYSSFPVEDWLQQIKAFEYINNETDEGTGFYGDWS